MNQNEIHAESGAKRLSYYQRNRTLILEKAQKRYHAKKMESAAKKAEENVEVPKDLKLLCAITEARQRFVNELIYGSKDEDSFYKSQRFRNAVFDIVKGHGY